MFVWHKERAQVKFKHDSDGEENEIRSERVASECSGSSETRKNEHPSHGESRYWRRSM